MNEILSSRNKLSFKSHSINFKEIEKTKNYKVNDDSSSS